MIYSRGIRSPASGQTVGHAVLVRQDSEHICYDTARSSLLLFIIINDDYIYNKQTMESQESIHVESSNANPLPVDIIQQTRKLVRGMDQQQRFENARKHLCNALEFKSPRLDTSNASMSLIFKVCYRVQTSTVWRNFLLLLSYVLMYLVIWEANGPSAGLIVTESLILLVMWADVAMEIYHKKYDTLRIASKFQLRFYARILTLVLLLVDIALAFSKPDLVIRPLLVFRCFLPLYYDSNVRKALQALIMSYKDILVLLVFYSAVVVIFAIIANQIIQIPRNQPYDKYNENYKELDKTIFIMYALSTYDAYPDYQLIAIRQSLWYYGFFIIFIFLNILFFATIPPSMVFNSFIETRSKIVLIDEIKQQHSLIMSFVSLGEQNMNISRDKFVRFLLYVYKNKIRYVDHITEICRRLDQNNNGVIHVKEFLHLCQILQEKTSMLPPLFPDWGRWMQFRSNINDFFKFKKLIKTKAFKVCNSILIVFCFINSLVAIYTAAEVFNIIDDVLILIFCVELMVKIIGLGVQNFFIDPWNKLDFLIITLGLVFELLPQQFLPRNLDQLIKMTRIFRVTTLVKLISDKHKQNNSFYIRITRLFSQIAIVMPIVLRFLPLYLITLYTMGTVGMQIFRKDNLINAENSPYGTYEEFSNFQRFLYSQFLFVQILVESQWSSIVYDYAYRYGSFGLVMIFFVLCHAVLVTVLTSLMKGITWQVYHTMHQQLKDRKTRQIKKYQMERALEKRKELFAQVKARTNEYEAILPDNIIAKELYENKIDGIIFNKLKENYDAMKTTRKLRKRRRSDMIEFLIKEHNLLINGLSNGKVSRKIMDSKQTKNGDDFLSNKNQTEFDIDDEDDEYNQVPTASSTSNKELVMSRTESQILDLDAIEIQGEIELREEDIEEQMEQILNKISLHNKIQYSEVIIYPKTLTEYLDNKFRQLKDSMMEQAENTNQKQDEAEDVFIDGLNYLLSIQMTQREQKALILDKMVSDNILTREQSGKALAKRLSERDTTVDSHWIMRKAFLSETNEKMIKKFEIEYFAHVYGRSFHEINKITLEPLLRLESKLTYCLRNALRYRRTTQEKFFSILCTIEDTISNQLLKKGSIFKFVYQIDQMSDLWFSIELRDSNQLRIHFIKNGIWIYHKDMKANKFMMAQDIFNCETFAMNKSKISCEKYVKMLFESFESLAFCLIHDKMFFHYNPGKQVYDLYTFYRSVEYTPRTKTRSLSISKIMLVILEKSDQRSEPLSYPLTDIKQFEEDKKKKESLFKLDESENQTFNKLKEMEILDRDWIIDSEGIPFNYIVNLMTEVKEIITLYQANFVYQIERCLNNKLQKN